MRGSLTSVFHFLDLPLVLIQHLVFCVLISLLLDILALINLRFQQREHMFVQHKVPNILHSPTISQYVPIRARPRNMAFLLKHCCLRILALVWSYIQWLMQAIQCAHTRTSSTFFFSISSVARALFGTEKIRGFMVESLKQFGIVDINEPKV